MIRLQNKTPYEKVYGKVPDVSDPHIWGSTCFAHVPAERRKDKKLSAQATKYRFLGVSEEYKAYRLLDVYNNKFIYSRYVMFDTQHSVEIVSRAFGQEMTEETETSHSTSASGDTIPPSISDPSTTNTTRNKKRGLVETVGALDNKPKRPRRETKRPARFDDYKCYQAHLDKISQEETNHNKIPITRNL
ncbi:unnamed protein product [Phytophthora fragariaefolia]|uniref:Unnamed protein product n=1 Tax=Phytophthora fragariaefolia TaxID=1490495 RepID=A0A9W6YBJ1_9STRA|nr:unnamed protein product [Phytophthora fragariaefolia]